MPSCVCPGCAVHHITCTVQPRGRTGMGQLFSFARVRWWNIVQVRMLHLKKRGKGIWSTPSPVKLGRETGSSPKET